MISRPEDVGKTINIKRPKGFFDKDGMMPKVAKLTLTKLPALAHLSDEDYAAHLRQLIQEHEQRLRQQMQNETTNNARLLVPQARSDGYFFANPAFQ